MTLERSKGRSTYTTIVMDYRIEHNSLGDRSTLFSGSVVFDPMTIPTVTRWVAILLLGGGIACNEEAGSGAEQPVVEDRDAVPDEQSIAVDSASPLLAAEEDGTGYIPPGPAEDRPPSEGDVLDTGPGVDGAICSGVEVMPKRIAVDWSSPVDDKTLAARIENTSQETVTVTPRFRMATPRKAGAVTKSLSSFNLGAGDVQTILLDLAAAGLPIQAMPFSAQVMLELALEVDGASSSREFSQPLYFHWNDDQRLVTYNTEARRTRHRGGDYSGGYLSDAQVDQLEISEHNFGGVVPTRVVQATRGGGQ